LQRINANSHELETIRENSPASFLRQFVAKNLMDLSSIAIVDHHAHPLLPPGVTADAVGFRRWFTESTDPEIHGRYVPHTLFFRTAIRWLGELLDCPPTLEEVLAARARQEYPSWVQRLFREANIGMVLCDYGYQGDEAYSHSEMKALLGW